MRLLDEQWRDGFLDETREADDCRISVRVWVNLQRLDDLYFVRRGGWRMLYRYVRTFGVQTVAAKVASRRKERLRNEKFLSVGIGSVADSGPDGRIPPGTEVVFVAPCHPRCVERVVLPTALVQPVSASVADHEGHLLYGHAAPEGGELARQLAGWSPFAGIPLDPRTTARFLQTAGDICGRVVAARDGESFPVGSPVREETGPERETERPRAVLFGYGNYAKSMILPNVRRHIDVVRVHEIDPTQIGPVEPGEVTWDTSSRPRASSRHDVWLIAGYHSTHAPLAVAALRAGAAAVVEKPLVTTREQAGELLRVLEETGGAFFAGFNRRYSSFNALARTDLQVPPGGPISYYSIVFEERLPARHWYRWPASRSAVTSNGCHWLDHFLFLNDFSPVAGFNVAAAGDDVSVTVELDNGAFFSMTLTSRGSDRVGMESHVQLRAGDRTVRITNDSTYVAESGRRVLRRRRSNRSATYVRMYRSIAQRIAEGRPGDTIRSIAASTSLVLDIEDELGALRSGGPPPAGRGSRPGA